MNFGEKLKQIRTERGMTQPQLAALAGIEQSYLSKLENEKSVPSAEMFNTLLAGLGMEASAFLVDIDQDVLDTTLRHIPSVGQFRQQVQMENVQNHKHWLYGAALAWLIGFAMMLAANDGIIFPKKVYVYYSPGLVLAGEAENIFEKQAEILGLRLTAKLITPELHAQQLADFQTNRVRPLTVESTLSRGNSYVESIGSGHRRFELIKTSVIDVPGNRILQFLGAVLLVAGFLGLFIEWRLRRLKK